MNPLIKKFEEVYGKKPEEGGMIEQIAGAQGSPDVISLGGGHDSVLTLNTSNIPSSMISSGITCINTNTLTSYTRAVSVPHQTPVEQQFFKVLEDVGKGRATVSEIKAEIDQSFTGFGGQIKYTVEIIGTYP